MRQAFSIVCLSLLLLLILLSAGGCAKKRNIGAFNGNDAVMLDRVRDIGVAINQYYADNAEWPLTLAEVREKLPAGVSWPLNPYTNTEIQDTGSPEFDPAKSVGMVFYEKLLRDDQISTFALHVFGDKGELIVLYSRDFVASKGQ